MIKKFIRNLTILIFWILSAALVGCDFGIGYQPPGLPLTIVAHVDNQGHVTIEVVATASIVTPIGTFSASASLDPAQYIPGLRAVQNTLIVRVNGEDHVFDLNGQDVNISLEPGYYRQIALRSDGSNWLLVLEPVNGLPLETATPMLLYEGIVTVQANIERNRTGIFIEQGSTVMVDFMDGQWRAGPLPTWPYCGPEGDPQTPNKRTFPIRDAPIMSLVIGIDNTVVDTVGRHLTLRSAISGTLWFGANDDNFTDNVGSLRVSIRIVT